MTEEHKERIYEGVRRMVIWDEPRADVFHRLEVNGIDPAEAQQMYDKARAERIAIIRADAVRTAGGGLGLLLIVGYGAFFGYWNGLGISIRPTYIACALAAGFGTWRIFKGLFGFFFAPSKEGSLINHEED